MRKPSFSMRGVRAAALALAVAMAAVPAPALAEGLAGQPEGEAVELQAQSTLSASDFKLTYRYVNPESPLGDYVSSSDDPTVPYKGEEYVLDQDIQFDVQYLPDPDTYVEVDINEPTIDLASLGRKEFSLTVSVPYIEGLEDQKVTIDCAFTIEKVDIASSLVELWNEPPIYGYGATASDIDWDPRLYYRDYLVKGVDYDVVLPATINEGDNQLTIVGKGNYTGSLTVNFTVGWDLDSPRADLHTIGTSHGDEHDPVFKSSEMSLLLENPSLWLGLDLEVTFCDESPNQFVPTVVPEDDYDLTMSEPDENGKGIITATAKQGACVRGSISIPYTVLLQPIDLSKATITLDKTSYTYTGKAIKPAIKNATVPVAGQSAPLDISLDVNWSGVVTYSSNIKAGTAKALVKINTADYIGTATATFKIAQAPNTAKTAKTSVKKTVKVAAAKKKAQTVALPKVTAKFGKAKWSVVKKDAKKVLSLKGNKVVVKKGAKKGTYTIKLKASVAKTSNYKAASTKMVVVKVTVK